VCDVQARALCDDGVKTRAARAQSMTAEGGVQEEENTGIYKVDDVATIISPFSLSRNSLNSF